MTLSCIIIDAGARYGIHPTWMEIKDNAEFHLFEVDETEAQRLKKKYELSHNINIHNIALFSEQKKISLFKRDHRGLNSFFQNNELFINDHNFMLMDMTNDYKLTVKTNTIDNFFADITPHFLKIDTEGSELDILKGSKNKLMQSILGVRTEVHFAEVYKNVPLFGQIYEFMRECDFELINLSYDGKGHSYSEYTLPNKYGQLISTDAVWIKNIKSILSDNNVNMLEDVILLSLFLLFNNATDMALSLLIRGKKEFNLKYTKLEKDLIFLKLKASVAHLFKSIVCLPYTNKEKLYQTYLMLFNQEFPKQNEFYETFQL